MKKILILTSILAATVLQAQTYHPFPTTNAIWHTVGVNVLTGNECVFNFGLQGDTLIGGQTWSKLYLTPDSVFSYPLVYSGALRENESRQVFLKLPSEPELIIYNFNMQPGDTILYPFGYCLCGSGWGPAPNNSFRVVTSVDSLLLYNGEYRKRWHLSGPFMSDDQWVEGIGSITWFGLLNPLISDIALCGDEYFFGCCIDQNQVLYFDATVCSHCMGDYILGTQESFPPRQQFRVYYDQPSSSLIVHSDRDPGRFSLLVCNTLGQVMKHAEGINTRNFALNSGNLKQGMYFWRIGCKAGSSYSGKFMIY